MIAKTLLAAFVSLLCAAAAAQPAPMPGPQSQDGARLPGKFIWFELVTDDPEAARAFYQSVFGWNFRPVPGAPASYTVIENGADRVGGMFTQPRKEGAARASRWLAVMSVADVAAAAQYATKSGGSVVAPVATVPGRGAHALLRDSGGALFAVLRTERGDPADTPVEDGDFFWLDLLAKDPRRAAAFYRGLAGYEVGERETDSGASRLVLESHGYARAGILPLPPRLAQSGWLPYVLVSDVAATLAKVATARGSVLVQPAPELLDGRLAVIADPVGGVLGIVDWERQ